MQPHVLHYLAEYSMLDAAEEGRVARCFIRLHTIFSAFSLDSTVFFRAFLQEKVDAVVSTGPPKP